MTGSREQRIINALLVVCLAAGFICFALIVLPGRIAGLSPEAIDPKLPQPPRLSAILPTEEPEETQKTAPLPAHSGTIAQFIPKGVKPDELAWAGHRSGDQSDADRMPNEETAALESDDANADDALARELLGDDTLLVGDHAITHVVHPVSSLARGEPSALDSNSSRRHKAWIFPPDTLTAEVNFWRDIYGTYDNDHIVLHHPRYLDIVYDVVDVSDITRDVRLTDLEKSHRRKKRLDERRDEVSETLMKLSKRPSASSLTEEEWRIRKLFTNVHEKNAFRRAALDDGVRAQYGQRDKFIAGLIYSGQWLGEIERIFTEEYGLPRELTRLIFVESMFNPRAGSSVGATGLWQFMRSTGKLYLNINTLVDERYDPIAATHGAAKLLRHNENELGTWPLALNAYNTGRGRMQQAVKRHGTNDIAHIIKNFEHRSYGFASRNFVPEFLAALDVAEHTQEHFGPIAYDEPLRYDLTRLDYHISLPDVARIARIPMEEIIELNLSLRASVIEGKQLVPIGYPLRVPKGKGTLFAAAASRAPKSTRGALTHKVGRNETIFSIAQMYRVEVDQIRSANPGVGRRPRRGQVIKIPFE